MIAFTSAADYRAWAYQQRKAGKSDVIEPEEGMPVTVYVGSDSYGGRVVKIWPSKNVMTITYGRDDRETERCQRRKDGEWFTTRKNGHLPVSIGYAETHWDRSF